MKVTALSVKYPTLLQTWFINYLQSMEDIGHQTMVYSLFPGEDIPHPKTSMLQVESIWTANTPLLKRARRAIEYSIRNLFEGKLYHYIYSSFKYTESVKDAFYALTLAGGLANSTPDIFHIHSEKCGYRLLPLLKTTNTPVVLTFHGLPPDGVRDIDPKKRELLYKSIDLIITNTGFAKAQCLSLTNISIPIKVIPQGIILEEFQFKPARDIEKGIRLLTVGRLDRLKGHTYAIDAVKQLVDNGIKVEYEIVGSGLYKDSILKQITELKLEGCVVVTDSITDERLRKAYQASHIFILPSIHELGSWAETQGIVIQEAQACGVLTIATNTGGIPECIIDGETGFLVEQKSAEAISDKIEFLLNNQDRWDTWRQAARKHVEKHFDYRDMGRRLVESYEEILEQY